MIFGYRSILISVLMGAMMAVLAAAQGAVVTREQDDRRQVVEYRDGGQLRYTRMTLFQDLAGGKPLVLYLDAKGRLIETVFLSCDSAICRPVPVGPQGQELLPEASLFFNPDKPVE